MTRFALIALAVLLIFGVVVSVLPSPQSEAKAEVKLEGVSLELYPAADPDAKWFFNAKTVTYNPDTRESIVDGLEDGRRMINGLLDSTIRTKQIIIDSADNLRTQQADIYVLKNCLAVQLGRANAAPVYIDQNAGYRAPYAVFRAPNFKSTGEPFDASFDLTTTMNLGNAQDEVTQGGKERCVQGKLLEEKP